MEEEEEGKGGEGEEEEENDDNRGNAREEEMRYAPVDSKLRTTRERQARAARTEAEINRRKSLLPSALSGPFRPVKIIYRKDWCARASFSRRMNFEMGRSVMWKSRKEEKKKINGKCTRRENGARDLLYTSRAHSALQVWNG